MRRRPNKRQRIAMEAARLQPRLLLTRGQRKLPPMGVMPPPPGNRKARLHWQKCMAIAARRANKEG